MNQQQIQLRTMLDAIVSIHDFVDSISCENERAYSACMAARSCILLAASLADVDGDRVVDILDAKTNAARARSLIDDATGRGPRSKLAEEVIMLARQLTAHPWQEWAVSEDVKHDARELHTAVWLYDEAAK